jgi:hypothetical protein
MGQVEHSVSVEEVVFALEEDCRHVLEESLEVRELLSGFDVIHKLEDSLASAERDFPGLHLDRALELLNTKVKKLDDAGLVI